MIQVASVSFIVSNAFKDNTVPQNPQHRPHLSQQSTVMHYSLRGLSHQEHSHLLASLSGCSWLCL